MRPLLDEVHRERGAVGPGAVGEVREVPWYPYQKSDIEIRLTRDGHRALSSFDGKVRLWDLDTGRCLREIDGLRGPVDLGPDGRQAVGVGSDGLVRLYDLADGRCLQTFTPAYRSGDTAVRRPCSSPGRAWSSRAPVTARSSAGTSPPAGSATPWRASTAGRCRRPPTAGYCCSTGRRARSSCVTRTERASGRSCRCGTCSAIPSASPRTDAPRPSPPSAAPSSSWPRTPVKSCAPSTPRPDAST